MAASHESSERSMPAETRRPEEQAAGTEDQRMEFRRMRWMFRAGLAGLLAVATVGLGGQFIGLQTVTRYAYVKGQVESAEEIAKQLAQVQARARVANDEATEAARKLEELDARVEGARKKHEEALAEKEAVLQEVAALRAERDQAESLTESIATLVARREAAVQAAQQAADELATVGTELERTRRTLTEMQSRVAALGTEEAELTARIDGLQDDERNARQDVATTQQRLEQEVTSLRDYETLIQARMDAQAALDRAIVGLVARRDTAEQAAQNAAEGARSAEQEAQQAADDLAEVETQLESTRQSLLEAQGRLAALGTEETELRARIDRLRGEEQSAVPATATARQELEQALSSLRDNDALVQERSERAAELAGAIQARTEVIAALDQEISDLRAESVTVRAEVTATERTLAQLREDSQSESAIVGELRAELARLRSLESTGLTRLQQLLDTFEKTLTEMSLIESPSSSSMNNGIEQ